MVKPKSSGSSRKQATSSVSGIGSHSKPWQLPLLTPQIQWTAKRVEDLPDLRRLSNTSIISVDTETKDPRLETHGPGFQRKEALLVGVSLWTEETGPMYIPLAHGDGTTRDGNVPDPPKAKRWLKHQLAGPQLKVGHNLLYDMEALDSEDIILEGPLYCTMTAESLIDEWRRSYKLNDLALDYLNLSKNENELREAAQAYGVNPKSELWKLPAGYVGPYAETDAELPGLIHACQQEKIEAENLYEAVQVEMDLLRPLLAMRKQGVLVDLAKAEEVRDRLVKQEIELQLQLNKLAGFEVDVWSGPSLANAFSLLDIQFPRTALGNPSFEADWLDHHPSDLAQVVSQVRRYNKARGSFIDNMIFDHACRIDHQKRTAYLHSSFLSTRGERGGVKHGRFASIKPGLQLVPKHDEELAPLIRSLFIAEPGAIFGSCDYSAQEPRMQDHYCIGLKVKGWEQIAKAYADDPDIDRHAWVAGLMGRPRKVAKVLNLSLSYGGGIPTISAQLNCSQDEAKTELNRYHQACPWVNAVGTRFQDKINERGYLVLMGGRHCRFPRWEPANLKYNQHVVALPRREAEEKWPGQHLRRAYMHTATNRMMQGSCAYQTKRAMIEAYRAGIITPLPVHDELSGSRSSEKECRMLAQIMVEAVKLKVPTKVDLKMGKSWGECS